MTYRPIFRDYEVSFGQMQVVPLAEQYQNYPEHLRHIWVYDDAFVKGLVTLQTRALENGNKILQVEELYVDVKTDVDELQNIINLGGYVR